MAAIAPAAPRAARSSLPGLVLVAALAAACASAPPPAPAGDERPWQLPASELGQQSLFKLNYRGQEGGASLKLVLRLRAEDAYQLAAADVFGRPLWTLATDGAHPLWLDFRAERWCALGDTVRLPDLGLPDLPLRAVPALLLGRVPLPPAERDAKPSDYRDGGGHRWTVSLDGAEVEGWTYWDGKKPRLWFTAQGGEMVLSAREREAQLRWRRSLREPIAGAMTAAVPPAGFVEGGCDEPRLP